ncbi:MAG: hypothetical protein J6T10_08660 [Methanobrevibacter sp.]|nr:hypothetical protein [Methanobrevibacter sp.]
MAFNKELTNFISSSGSYLNTGASVLSLGSQIFEKGKAYITGEVFNKTSRGIGGFMLDIVKETTVNMRSEITDYPLESEKQIQTHYSNKPVSITITGVCSDIRVHNPNDEWKAETILDDLSEMLDKLTAISNNLKLGGATKECAKVAAYSKAIHTLYRKIKETYNRLAKLLNSGFFGLGEAEKTSQLEAYERLSTMWTNGSRITVETPWHKYGNCVIEDLLFTQPEDTNQQTEITIKFKQLNLLPSSVGLFQGQLDEKRSQQLSKAYKAANDKSQTTSYLLESLNRLAKSGDPDAQKVMARIKNGVDNGGTGTGVVSGGGYGGGGRSW